MSSNDTGWYFHTGPQSAIYLGFLPTWAYSIVPGYETCIGSGEGVPMTQGIAHAITKTYVSTLSRTPSITTSTLGSSSNVQPNASPFGGSRFSELSPPKSTSSSSLNSFPSSSEVVQSRSEQASEGALPPATPSNALFSSRFSPSIGTPGSASAAVSTYSEDNGGDSGVITSMLSPNSIGRSPTKSIISGSIPSAPPISLDDGHTLSILGSAPRQDSQSYIVVASKTYYDNPDGNYVFGTQTYTPGASAIMVSGDPISFSAHEAQPKPHITQNFVVYSGHTFLANAADDYVFGTQTYTPGEPAITATLTYPTSAHNGQQLEKLTETISFAPDSSAPSSDPSGGGEPWDKGAINAVMTWQHRIYTFYGDGKKNENVVSGHTLVVGGPSVTINGQTFWLDKLGRLNAQYSPTDSGPLPTMTPGGSDVLTGGLEGAGTTVGPGSGTGMAQASPGATARTTTSGARTRREWSRNGMWIHGIWVLAVGVWCLKA